MEEKIELIWKDYHDKLLTFIQKRVNNNDTSEDILQDVFVKILTRINTLRDTSKLQSWLYQVTRNAISDYYRDKKKADTVPAGVLEMEFENEDNMMKDKLTECCLFNVDVYGNILDYNGKGNRHKLC